jgi:hypothetical protein
MSETLARIQALVARGEVEPTVHALGRLETHATMLDDVVAGVASALLVEDYPDATRGPTVLVLQRDSSGDPLHVLWGIPRSGSDCAVLITAYRPDPELWSAGFTKRRSR